MDPLVRDRIAQLSELGTQSPLHAMRAVEEIRRLSASPATTPSQETVASRMAQTTVAQHMDMMPSVAMARGAESRIRPAPQPDVTDVPALMPTQYPPVIDARNHPPSYALTVQPMMAPTLYLVVPDIPQLDPQEESPGERLDFSLGDGILIGMRGTVLAQGIVNDEYESSASKEMDALCGLELTLNGQEQLIVDGATQAYAWYSDLFGGDAVQWTPIMRHVLSSDVLHMRFFNRSILLGPTIQPSLMFAYRRLPMPIAG